MRYGRLFLGLCGLVVAGCTVAAAQKSETAHDGQAYDEIARGRYLAILGDCSGCHTDKGGKPFAGGLPVETPFGIVAAANITPDPDTGIGTWSDDEFVAAVQRGKAKGGVHLYPAMPYPSFAKMPRADVLAIRAYLDTLQPVHHRVRSDRLPFPFDIRASMIGWNLLFFHPAPFQGDPSKSTAWNRGAYLVEGPGHCGACHTPKNFLGGDKSGDALQGAVLQGWDAPDLTSDARTGLADWSTDDIVAYLKAGRNPHAAASGPMADVITDSTSHMRDDDLKAIATYLKDLPAPEAPAQPALAASDPAMRAGQAIYVDNCEACHAGNGGGVANLIPPLKDSPVVESADATSLIRVVLHGTQNVATGPAPTGPAMPAFAWKLNDEQAAAVLTYVRNAWGNAAPAVDSGAVGKIR